MSEMRQLSTKAHSIDSTSDKSKSKGKPPITTVIGLVLTCITIILQCVAFSTPHWKEVSPNAHSLYVDGVDALIRTEVLHYFNSIHRYTRHSYGLFHRCEYVLSNSSVSNQRQELSNFFFNRQGSKCTKNYLPSYGDEHFNECHSLPYYRFCAKANEKNFDVSNDYLRANFDISASQSNPDSRASCDCHYPPYVVLCRIIGIFALLCLLATSLLYTSFLLLDNPHYRLKVRCFGFLASVLAIILLLINLIVVLQHMEYESLDYLIAIQRHYRSNQIYKLSSDTKTAIDRFLTSIDIRMGYSAIIAWVAFILAIVDGILFLAPCQISEDPDDMATETHAPLMSSMSEQSQDALAFTPMPNESQTPVTPILVTTTLENHIGDAHSTVPPTHRGQLRTLPAVIEDEV